MKLCAAYKHPVGRTMTNLYNVPAAIFSITQFVFYTEGEITNGHFLKNLRGTRNFARNDS
jgi:hypothetical protein